MKLIFSDHARRQMAERGASEAEVTEAVTHGERTPAKQGRTAHRRNFDYNHLWSGRHYHIKQVMPVTKEESNHTVVITVYTFYF
ncbi:MAG: DUF4258 domain-containing protein [Candidatus Omnitrophica bacterium]|nr:DUF4258 domain-containing protein [Candidatus Omnitrophota bacterium]